MPVPSSAWKNLISCGLVLGGWRGGSGDKMGFVVKEAGPGIRRDG